ncbi:MAG: lipoyl(octanoyl) transferase [Anaerolineales bacterium]|nr:lipoyl(octanoyl) transferase [Anaerolineales bacterium]
MNLNVIDLGLIEYETAWKLQDEYAAEIAEGKRLPTLLLLEHPHVYTFGRKGHAENLLWNEEQLKQKGISIHWVDRGGDVTYHGPGQLVGYPLLPLTPIRPDRFQNESSDLENESVKPVRSDIKADYVGYVRKLEQTLITALSRLGVESGQRSGLTGVWIQKKKPAKIAAIGVKVDVHGVSRHGFALNVNPDMEYWEGIIACGLSEPVVSLADLLPSVPSMERVKQEISAAFCEMFWENNSKEFA